MLEGTLTDTAAANKTAPRQPAEEDTAARRHPSRAPGRPVRPPVNIRLSLPMLRWRFYITLMAGRERRGETRRIEDRTQHPVRTAGNIMFIVAGAITIYLLTLGAFLAYAMVIGN